MIHPIHTSPFAKAIYGVICDEMTRVSDLYPHGNWPDLNTERTYQVLQVWRDLFESGKDIEMEIGTSPWPIRL